jgi:hypothetical protein
MRPELKTVLAQQKALFQALADNTDELAACLASESGDVEKGGGDVIGLADAAKLAGEPSETFRKRPEFLKARISRPGEHRLRYSKRVVERIIADRLESNAAGTVDYAMKGGK